MKNRISGDPHAFPLSGDLGPGNTALLVIDMQHDFCSEGGYMHRLGAPLSGLRAPIEPIRRVLAAARAAGYHVLHTREGYRSDLADLQPWKRGGGPNDAIAIGDAGPMGRALIRGEPCWEIISELSPAPGEPVLDKASYGPFATTDIDALLRNWGVRNLVLTGVTTDCCITSCLREALDRGYDCLVLADCVGSADPVHHEAALTLMRKRSGVFGTTATSVAFIDAMPNESRVISFSNAEAIDALVDYCSTNKRELPKGAIKRLSFSNDSEIRVTAEFDNGTPSISFYENEVAVALILRCNKKGIPVPRRAVKSLQVTQDSIALQLSMRT